MELIVNSFDTGLIQFFTSLCQEQAPLFFPSSYPFDQYIIGVHAYLLSSFLFFLPNLLVTIQWNYENIKKLPSSTLQRNFQIV